MLSKIITSSRRVTGQNARCVSTLLKTYEEKLEKLPMREAVRYTRKNMKWTAETIDRLADSHAEALLQYQHEPGDTIALWLPDCAEKHVTMLAALKAGFKVAELDHTANTKEQLREFLAASGCMTIVFDPVNNSQHKMNLLRKAIPEFYEYNDKWGQFFHSKHFPKLVYFIHTGFNTETGALTYKSHFIQPAPHLVKVPTMKEATTDETVAYMKASVKGDGLEFSKWKTHKEVLAEPSYYFLDNLISQKHFECTGQVAGWGVDTDEDDAEMLAAKA